MMNKNILITSLLFVSMICCSPDRDDDINLPGGQLEATMSIESLVQDGNRFVVRDLSNNNYIRVWDFEKGLPSRSTKSIDTVFYSKAGEYTITLYVSKSDGSGTAFTSKKVTVLNDAVAACSSQLSLLTGDCLPQGKCWTLSRKAGAVKVGPTYDDYSWFTSPENGLQDAQYDDAFCFTFQDFLFQNKNNGSSVDPWDGYKAKPYDGGISEFVFQESTGINNRDQIIIPNDQFMGVWDNDNIMDIVKLTDNELITRARLRTKDGSPALEGWFELTFERR